MLRATPSCRAVLVPWLLTLLLGMPGEGRAETRVLPAVRDATLIEDPNGALANGSGPALFVGRTAQSRNPVRRALLAFDLSSLPRRAHITDVEFTLFVEPGNLSAAPLRLHRVLAGWSEGPARAAGGRGAPSGPGDVTWIHRILPGRTWQAPGGDAAPFESAAVVPPAAGPITWKATPALRADVQLWLEQPERNHGWLVRGDEDAPSTAQRLASREHPESEMRPYLVVSFDRRGTACEEAGLGGAALGLCRAWCESLDCDASTTRAADRACDVVARAYTRRAGGTALPCALPDRDGDGVADDVDLCPDVPDAGQGDADVDGVGDACDNCPAVANPDQTDVFGASGVGDACDCPCFTGVDVAGLALDLGDATVYRDLRCIDTRIGVKPLSALRAVRVDGDDCGTESVDCSALAVSFTEDRVCAWNPPAPTAPLTVQGLSDPQREACRAAILAGASSAGLACR